MNVHALVMVFLTEAHRELVAQNFELIYAPNEGAGVDRSNSAAKITAHGHEIRVVLTNGATGITIDEINALPKLEILGTLGVGYENVPVEYLKQRGIRVCNAAGTNEDCVADHAMGLLLAAIRGIPFLNHAVRRGVWRDAIPRPTNVSYKRLGFLGMGYIRRIFPALHKRMTDLSEIGFSIVDPRKVAVCLYVQSPSLLLSFVIGLKFNLRFKKNASLVLNKKKKLSLCFSV